MVDDIEVVGTETKLTVDFTGVNLKVSYDIFINGEDSLAIAKADADNLADILKHIVEDFVEDYKRDGQEVE